MALHAMTHEDITALVPIVTELYVQNIAVHFCRRQHRGVLCTDNAHLLHNGTHPLIQVIYISPLLQQAAKVIIRSLKETFPPQFAAGDDGLDGIQVAHPVQRRMKNIFMCPGCGVRFENQ